MVAIVTGAGLGLDQSSASFLKAQGQLGSAAIGQAGDDVTVNAANGDLVVQASDQMLFGLGLNDVISRTYNSQGVLSTGNNGALWSDSNARYLKFPTGFQLNTAGSTVQLVSGDGGVVTYTYNGLGTSAGAYVANEGGSAYDTLTFSSTTGSWTWTDGASQDTDVYNGSGQLISSIDSTGQNSLTYHYTNGLLSSVQNADGETLIFAYNGSNQLNYIQLNDAGASKTLVFYTYDSSGRLTSSIQELDSTSATTPDSDVYYTNYGYNGSTNQLATISQSDGSYIKINYNSAGQVSSWNQAESSSVVQTTTLTYDPADDVTMVTDQQGDQTELAYNTTGELTQVTTPPSAPGTQGQTTYFLYDANGDLTYSGPLGDPEFSNISSNWNSTYSTNSSIATAHTTEIDGGVNVYRRQTQPATTSAPAGYAMNVGPLGDAATLTPVSLGQTVQVGAYVASSGASNLQLYVQWFSASDVYLGNSLVNANVATGGSFGTAGGANANFAAGSATASMAGTAYALITIYATASGTGPLNVALAEPTLQVGPNHSMAYDPQFSNLGANWDDLSQGSGITTTQSVATYSNGVSVYTRSTPSQSPSSSFTMNLGQSGSPTTWLAVSQGQMVQANVAAASSGASQLQLYVEWFNASGGYLGHTLVGNVPTGGTLNTGNLANMTNGGGLVNATFAGTAYAALSLTATAAGAGPLTVSIAEPVLKALSNASAVVDPQFSNIAANWNNVWTSSSGMTTSQSTELDGGTEVYRRQTTGSTSPTSGFSMSLGQTTALANLIAVTPGQAIDASAYAASVNAVNLTVYISWFNSAGTYLGNVAVGTITPGGSFTSPGGLAGANQGGGVAIAPTTAAYACMSVAGTANGSGQLNVAIADPMLRVVSGGQTASVPTGYSYTYNSNGDRLSQVDTAGDETTWTYNANNQVLTESSYQVAGGLASSSPVTNYDIYSSDNTSGNTDGEDNLLYSMTPWGSVTQYVYGAQPGEVSETIQFANTYTGAVTPSALNPSALSAWASGNTAGEHVTSYTYQSDGQLSSTIQDTSAVVSGGIVLTPISVTTDSYDSSGDLLSAQTSGFNASETNVYDGLGRVISATDADGVTTTYAYTVDSAGAVTTATNTTTSATTVSQYDEAGDLISTSETGPGISTAITTSYAYNSLGQLAVALDPNGSYTYYLYDALGRKAAEILNDGTVTTYAYNANDQVNETIHYANKLTPAQLSLVDIAAYAAQAPLSQVLPAMSSGDEVTYSIYDAAGRLAETISPIGAVTTYAYNGASQLTSTTAYATAISSATLATYETAPPTALVLPAADPSSASNPSGDQTSYSIYDTHGRKIYDIDAAGDVTQYSYDNFGNVVETVQYALTYNSTYPPTASTMGSFTTPGANDRVSQAVYDTAGRKAYDIVGAGGSGAAGLLTGYSYNGAGQVTQVVQYASPYSMTSVPPTVASLSAPALGASDRVSQNVYDADGRLAYAIDGQGQVTAYAYNANGNEIQTVAYEALYTISGDGAYAGGASTYSAPSAAPTLASMNAWAGTPANQGAGGAAAPDQVTKKVYDALGRLVYSIDGDNYVTQYKYDQDSNVVQTIVYASNTYAVGYNESQSQMQTLLSGTPSTPSQINTSIYNSLGQLAYSIDSVGDVVGYSYDAFGNVAVKHQYVTPLNSTQLSNVQASPTLNTFNANAPASVNGDAVTNYVYDRANRLLQQSTAVYLNSGATSTTEYQNTYYDTFGNTILSTDALGNHTFFYYDQLDRKVGEINAVGTLSTWSYNAFGDATAARVYGDFVTPPSPSAAGGNTPAPVSSTNYRETDSSYNYDDELTQTTLTGELYGSAGIWVGSGTSGGSYSASQASAIVSGAYTYDAFGDVTSQADGDGDTTYYYYDSDGRKIAQVDPTKYLTTYALDQEGDTLTEYQYANATTAAMSLTTTLATIKADTAANSGADRITTFAYDGDGNRTSETRDNVAASTVSGDNVSTTLVNSTVSYSYNMLGEVLSQAQATGDTTYYYYNSAGQLKVKTSPSYTNASGGTVEPQITYAYDGLGDLLSTSVGDGDNSGTTPEVTTDVYGAGGRLVSTTNSLTSTTSFTQTFSYDADGRLTVTSYNRLKSNNSTVQEEKVSGYDALGRAIYSYTADWNGTSFVDGDNANDPYTVSNDEYDAYGELIAKGTSAAGAGAAFQEFFGYDLAGHLVDSNANGGAVSVFVDDADGNATLEIDSAGANFYSSGTTIQSQTWVLSNYTTVTSGVSNGQVLSADASSATATISVYDGRSEKIYVVEPQAQLGPSTSQTLTTAQTYDAFGDVISQTDARGYKTTYSFNTLGDMIQEVEPQVTVQSVTAGVLNTTSYTAPSGNTTVTLGSLAATYLGSSALWTAIAQMNNIYSGSVSYVIPGNTTISIPLVTLVNPTLKYFYDTSGRQVGSQDANGNINTRTLLAGSGYDGAAALETEEFHADGGAVKYGYDVFGNKTASTNALNVTETFGYNLANQLITDTKPVGNLAVTYVAQLNDTLGSVAQLMLGSNSANNIAAIAAANGITGSPTASTPLVAGRTYIITPATSGNLVTTYGYDGLGQRITQSNSALGSGYTQTTDYDSLGRVIQTDSYAGHQAVYNYSWNATLADSGLNTTGAWVETTNNSTNGTADADASASQSTDYFGREIGSTDYNGNIYAYTYNVAGWLTAQTSKTSANVAAQNLAYTYYNTGKQATAIDHNSGATSAYSYDADGDKLTETLAIGTTSYENATSTYDALDRLSDVSDSGYKTTAPANISYSYDANGNVREINAVYTDALSIKAGAPASTSQQYWYTYDSMNRVLVDGGSLYGATITDYVWTQTAGYADGSTYAYDLNGDRTSVSTTDPEVTGSITARNNEGGSSTFTVYYSQTATLNYVYNVAGEIADVYSNTSSANLLVASDALGAEQSGSSAGVNVLQNSYSYDALGRETGSVTYKLLGGGSNEGETTEGGSTVTFSGATSNEAYQVQSNSFNADSQSLAENATQVSYSVTGPATLTTSVTDFYYGAAQTTTSGPVNTQGGPQTTVTVTFSGVYEGGQVTGTYTSSGGSSTLLADSYTWFGKADLSDATYYVGATGGGGAFTFVYYTSGLPPAESYSQLTYDANGDLISAYIGDSAPRTVNYVSNFNDEIIYSQTNPISGPTGPTVAPFAYYYDFNGVQRGEISDNGASPGGTDQTVGLVDQAQANSASLFSGGAASDYANFDTAAPNQGNAVTAPATYTVRSGDTLQSIAQALWGDANLWYLIADANSLSAGQTLAAGSTLIIPANVTNAQNNTATNLVYNQANIVGNVQPTDIVTPPLPSLGGGNGCGGVGELVLAIVAVAVTAIVAPGLISAEGPILGGALAGGVGDLASQGLGLATGLQSQFSWSSLALSALGGAIGGGLAGGANGSGAILPNSDFANPFLAGLARGALGSALTQGVGEAAGLQSSFNWASVAAAGLGDGVTSQIAETPWAEQLGPVGDTFVAGTAGALAGAAAQTVVGGTDFGTSLIEQLPSVIGNTVGQGIAAAEQQPSTTGPNPLAGLPAGSFELAGNGLNDGGGIGALPTFADGQPMPTDANGDIVVTGVRQPQAAPWWQQAINFVEGIPGDIAGAISYITTPSNGSVNYYNDLYQFTPPPALALRQLRQQQQAFNNYTNNVIAPMTSRQLAIGGGLTILAGVTGGAGAVAFGGGALGGGAAFLGSYATAYVPWALPVATTGTAIALGAASGTAPLEAAIPEEGTLQLGGAYDDVRGVPGYEAHHIPADSVSPYPTGDGPAIAMEEADHWETASYGNSLEAQAYRADQADLIQNGDYATAQQMDINDIQSKFGSKYDDAIQQMLNYTNHYDSLLPNEPPH